MFTLDDALSAIKDRPEFVVHSDDGVCSINYVFQRDDSFDGIRANLRGTTFDERTGEILSLPFHKFFNVGQKPETQPHLLADLDGAVYEKLDGSLIHFWEHRGSFRAATRMSWRTPQASQAHMLVFEKPWLAARIREQIHEGYTPLFEYVAPSNQVVVHYREPRLVYLASRDRRTGEYSFSDVFADRAQRFPFSFKEIGDRHLDKENFEGYVCWLENGLWVKVKCDWYLQRHRALDAIMRPAWQLYQAVFEGTMDEIVSCSADRFKPALAEIQAEANRDFIALCSAVMDVHGKAHRMVGFLGDAREKRKRYAMFCRDAYLEMFPLLMLAYDGRDFTKPAQAMLVEGYKTKYREPIYGAVLAEA